jgi:hypothetical protein
MFGGAKSPRFCGRLGARKQRGFLLIGRARALLPGGEINPLSLFAGGAQGWWREAADPRYGPVTMWQDSAGTTPVTAVEQPVGLVLDRKHGLVRGPELVTNGTFDANINGWSNGLPARGNIAWNAGTLVVTNAGGAGGFARATQALATTIGRSYEVSFMASGSFQVGKSNNADGSSASSISSGTRLVFTANVATSYLTLLTNSATDAVAATFDNISVRELPGNHNVQATAADRPILSARYNLLTKTEQFEDVLWVSNGSATRTNNYAVAPDGTNTATRVVFGSNSNANQIFQVASTVAASYRQGVWMRATAGAGLIRFGGYDGTNIVTTAVNLTADWQYFSTATALLAFASSRLMWIYPEGEGYATDILVWHPDVRLSADAALNIPAYQYVNTATDYTTDGFPHYFRLNGTNQSWATAGTVDFTGTDKVSLVYGVTTIGAATTAILAELSATANSNNGSFYVLSPASAGAGFAVATRGTVAANAGGRQEGATAANRSAVFSSALNLAGTTNAETVSVRVNGVVATTSDLNTVNNGGNFGNYTAYTGRRAGSSLPFNGRIYSEIAVGATITATQITAVERYTARRMGVQL